MGGRPSHTLDMPSACVKAHLLALRRMKQNGAVIFIDSAAAYYSIAKDVLVLTPQQKADSQLLHKRAELLFDDLQLQAEFVNIVQSSAGELDAAMSTELQRFLQQQLDTTWYVSRNNASHAFVAESGTAPGSPLADVMFSLVFGRVLKRTAAFLKSKGMQATIVAETAQGHGLTPTWADDVSILLQTSSVESVVPAVADTISYFLDELRQAGLKANFGPGKTEALLSINGQGARKMRQQLFCQECPAVSFGQHGEAGSIRVTATYEYLGSLIQADGHALPSILHRRTLAREMFRPVKNRMLRNPALTVGEKTDLLRSRILTRFFYGSGLWTFGTKREQETIDETVYGFYRSAFRHVLAVSSQGYANEELAGALGLPLPREILNVERVRTLTQLARGGFQQVLQELSYDATWWQSALAAIHAIGLAKEDVSSLDDVLSAANLSTSEAMVGYAHAWQLPPEKGTIFRIKAILAVKGHPYKHVFHAVMDVSDEDDAGPWAEGEKKVSKIVFIGKSMDQKFLREGFHDMILYDNRSWLGLIFRFRGTVLTTTWRPILAVFGASLLVWLLEVEFPVKFGATGNTIFGPTMCYLLVFRANNASRRYWLGRGYLTRMFIALREFIMLMCVGALGGEANMAWRMERAGEQRRREVEDIHDARVSMARINIIRLALAFTVSVKLHTRIAYDGFIRGQISGEQKQLIDWDRLRIRGLVSRQEFEVRPREREEASAQQRREPARARRLTRNARAQMLSMQNQQDIPSAALQSDIRQRIHPPLQGVAKNRQGLNMPLNRIKDFNVIGINQLRKIPGQWWTHNLLRLGKLTTINSTGRRELQVPL
ncbi:hypothetical protein AK812_SmicGene15826 [Symbiodinium microadriaticum]|uniref:CobW C-terminal domain-containing protein n=1 Tax=Symbiodinium microadriaticum TaxID=2951 RepID=A0A1Q9E1Z3_SYMMI|nr:hypothetical protein AK812_SmicGene15826 [Symbiodinium microadriaticum]